MEENKFENVLQSLRVRKGKAWTQPKTANELGVSVRTYKGWENGERVPSPRDLKSIAALFSLDAAAEAELYLAASQAPAKVHNLPFPRNPFFTGRDTYFAQLDDLYKAGNSVALTGLGGIGKTQLALEYAYRCFPNVYKAVFWVTAEDEMTLQDSYDELAHMLVLPEWYEREPDKCVQAVKHWLERHTNWLLVMDNADNLPLARSFFPEAHYGRILLTTRSYIVGNIATPIVIERMPPAEGLPFLLRRSNVLRHDALPETVAADIREKAAQLVELLGGHPLALDQAGAYIEEGVSFSEYKKLYQERRNDLLRRRGSLDNENKGKYSEHPDSVVVTFELCFAKARQRHLMASSLMHFCAFCEPDTIPMKLFEHDINFMLNTTQLREGITALLRYSLIRRNMKEQTFSMHRLVQDVLIDAMSPALQKEWSNRVEQALIAIYPLSFLITGRDRAEKAERRYQLILEFREKHLGAEHIAIAIGLRNLAVIYMAQFKYEQAEPLLVRALSIQESQLGAEHYDTAWSLYLLGRLYHEQHKYEHAELWYRRAFRIFETNLESEYRETAVLLYALAELLYEQGKHDQAEALHQQAHGILEHRLGAPHPEIKSLERTYAKFRLRIGRSAEPVVQAINDETSE